MHVSYRNYSKKYALLLLDEKSDLAWKVKKSLLTDTQTVVLLLSKILQISCWFS